jgi:hypothetical protein
LCSSAQILHEFLICLIRATCLLHVTLLHLMIQVIIFWNSCHITFSSPCHVISVIPLSTLFSSTLSTFSSLRRKTTFHAHFHLYAFRKSTGRRKHCRI